MNKKYSFIELIVWIIIFCIAVGAVRIWRYEQHSKVKSYQIFLSDADGLMVGSPVKYSGVQIGYIDTLKIVSNQVYARFRITQDDFSIPAGSIASVEFSGLGGSKSLELYPPTEQSIASKNLIFVDRPKRTHEALSLLKDMYTKIDSILLRAGTFAQETEPVRENFNKMITERKNGKPKH